MSLTWHRVLCITQQKTGELGGLVCAKSQLNWLSALVVFRALVYCKYIDSFKWLYHYWFFLTPMEDYLKIPRANFHPCNNMGCFVDDARALLIVYEWLGAVYRKYGARVSGCEKNEVNYPAFLQDECGVGSD